MHNKSGVLQHPTVEWGSKARKEEDRLRGTNHRARRENIAEQLEDDFSTLLGNLTEAMLEAGMVGRVYKPL